MSSMDRRIGTLFFWWDIFNIFLGAMLGGSIFSQLGQVGVELKSACLPWLCACCRPPCTGCTAFRVQAITLECSLTSHDRRPKQGPGLAGPRRMLATS